jgi:hypothetical protein
MAPSCALFLVLAAAQGSPTVQVGAVVREEAYVLEQVDPLAAGDLWTLLGAPARGTSPLEVGTLLWRRSEQAGVLTLEWDLSFHDRGTRVLEVERHAEDGVTLLYRELGPRSGRTLCADWIDEASALRLREWGGRNLQQSRLEAAAGGRFPLGLLEDLRAATQPPRSASVFDPLARSFEHLDIAVEEGQAGSPWAGTRLVRLARADGTSAGAWLLGDGVVLGFQWQSGGLRARRIGLDEYRRRLEALEQQRAALEASSAGATPAPAQARSE